MKKIILILAILLIAIGIATGIVISSRQHTVSGFEVFPCQYGDADQIDIAGVQNIQFRKKGLAWLMTAPVWEAIDHEAHQQLEQFMHARMLVDDQRELTFQTRQQLSIPTPTRITFFREGKELCGFELGAGHKYATADAERRWLFMDGRAYRTFVPLMDFGPMFEQPPSAWRRRQFFNLNTDDVRALEIWSAREHFKLDRQGQPGETNPQGWRMVSASEGQIPLDVSRFDIDERRIATVIELITPFIIDDWADGLSPEEISQMRFNGGLNVTTPKEEFRIQFGPTVDDAKHPEWRQYGEGTRYVRIEGRPRIGIISSRRLLGIFPSLDDMRSKRVWDADSTHLAAIEIQVGAHCLRYKPKEANVWESAACLHADTPVESAPIPNNELATYAKVINSLQAVRYATPEEKSEIKLDAAQIRLFMDDPTHVAYVLNLSDSVRDVFRYARVKSENAEGQIVSGPIFVLTEGISKLLLSDLTAQSANE